MSSAEEKSSSAEEKSENSPGGTEDLFKAAEAAASEGDHKKSAQLFEQAALGDLEIREAAERGHAGAAHRLGVLYLEGRGVTQSDEKAARFFWQSAWRKHAGGQSGLGGAFFHGAGVTQSYETAAELWRKAAELGDAEAQNNLGRCYEYGLGVPQSPVEAVWWCRRSADQGFYEAKEPLKKLLPAQRCAECGEPAKEGKRLSACMQCISASYCGRACQSKHFHLHKTACERFRKAREALLAAPIPDLSAKAEPFSSPALQTRSLADVGVKDDEQPARKKSRVSADRMARFDNNYDRFNNIDEDSDE